MKLAPHILYKRNDALFVDAVALEQGGARPREVKLGSFNLAGLGGVVLADQHFEPQAVFNPSDPRYCGTTLFAVELSA